MAMFNSYVSLPEGIWGYSFYDSHPCNIKILSEKPRVFVLESIGSIRFQGP